MSRQQTLFVCAIVFVAWSRTLSGQETHGDINLYGSPEGIFMQAKSAWPDIGAKLGNFTESQFTVRNASNSTLFAVKANGNVGIGTNNPTSRFTVVGMTADATLNHSVLIGDDTAMGSGVGGLIVLSGRAVTGVSAQYYGPYLRAAKTNGTSGDYGFDLAFGTRASGASPKERMRITDSGYVGIGTKTPAQALHVVGNAVLTGDLDVQGNIAARWQDVAEWVPSVVALPAGTVVVLDRSRSNHVISSSVPYDTAVAGVVSDRPGLILGEEGESKVRVATTGRVRVKVDARVIPIAIGDLLVSSSESGMAMCSVPVDIGRIVVHQPGTVIGKALEPLASGRGEILVLLSLQ